MQVPKCIICYKPPLTVEEKETRGAVGRDTKSEKLTDQLRVIFILKNLLRIPVSVLERHVKKSGNPGTWARTCSQCSLIVDEALAIFSQIHELKRKLDKLGEQSRNYVKQSYPEQKKVQKVAASASGRRKRVRGDSSGRDGVDTHLQITHDLRDMVFVMGCDGEGSSGENQKVQDDSPTIAVKLKRSDDILKRDSHVNDAEINTPEGVVEDGVDFITDDITIKEETNFEDFFMPEECNDLDEDFVNDDNLLSYRSEGEDDDAGGTESRDASLANQTRKKNKTLEEEGSWECDTGSIASSSEHKGLHRKTRSKSASNSKHEIEKEVAEKADEMREDLEKNIEDKDWNMSSDEDSSELENSDSDFVEQGKGAKTGRIGKKGANIEKNIECTRTQCNRRYATEEDLQRHIATFHEGDKKPFKCKSCGKGNHSRTALRIHMRVHSRELEEKSSSELSKHEADPIDSLNRCHLCTDKIWKKRKFANEEELKLHIKRNHEGDKKPCKCQTCGAGFSRSSLLEKHVKLHTDPQEWAHKCTYCNIGFNRGCSLWNHISSVHEIEVNKASKNTENKASKKNTENKASKNSNRSKFNFRCSLCNRGHRTEDSLQVHMFRKHKNDPKPHKCKVCGLGVSTSSYLRLHMQKHTGTRLFLCEICSKSFTGSSYLTLHKIKEHGEADISILQCKPCEKTFSTVFALRNHNKTVHQKKFKLICDICGYGCEFESIMKTHKLRHTGEKPAKCTYEGCNASFISNSFLNIHVRSVHTGEKPYTCTLCKTSYACMGHLTRHRRALHSGKTPYECEICHKLFPIKNYLTNHMRSHKKGKGKKTKAIKEQEREVVTESVNSESLEIVQEEQFQVINNLDNLEPATDKVFPEEISSYCIIENTVDQNIDTVTEEHV